MPAIIALVIRSIIQMAITLGVIQFAQSFILPMINKALEEIMEFFGVSEEGAKDILANELLQFVEQIGVGVLVLRSKLPTVVAEKLGFTSKGWNVRKTPSGIKITPVAAADILAAAAAKAPVPTAIEASGIIIKAKTALSGFGPAWAFLESKLGLIFLGFIAFNNLVDFGNWNSGAYQKTFQKIFAAVSFGLLVPDEDWRKTKTASPEVFDKVYNTYKLEGAISISDPFKAMSVLFTRDNLIDLIDKVGAILLRTKQSASTKDVLLATQLYINFKIPTEAVVAGIAAVPTAEAAAPAVPVITPIKVFTGLVTQGTLGEAEPFTARESDLISTAEELETAAQNNLAQLLVALPNRIIYEIKIVNSVVLKDGTKRTGTSQMIQTGVSKVGKPIYKKITNRFAVIDIFVFTSRNVRSKIDTIILGPTDSYTLQISTEQLSSLAETIKKSMITTKTEDIQKIITTTPTQIISPTAAAPAAPAPAAVVQPAPPPAAAVAPTPVVEVPVPTIAAPVVIEFRVSDIFASTNPNRLAATSISEFFDPNRVKYPTVEQRSKMYEAFGLGPASWYTGTAEQNVKLLAELKIKYK